MPGLTYLLIQFKTHLDEVTKHARRNSVGPVRGRCGGDADGSWWLWPTWR